MRQRWYHLQRDIERERWFRSKGNNFIFGSIESEMPSRDRDLGVSHKWCNREHWRFTRRTKGQNNFHWELRYAIPEAELFYQYSQLVLQWGRCSHCHFIDRKSKWREIQPPVQSHTVQKTWIWTYITLTLRYVPFPLFSASFVRAQEQKVGPWVLIRSAHVMFNFCFKPLILWSSFCIKIPFIFYLI